MHPAVEREALIEAGLVVDRVDRLLLALAAIVPDQTPEEAWSHLSHTVLRPDDPFPVHLLVHRALFAGRDPDQAPAPVWVPGPDDITRSNINRFCSAHRITPIESLHAWSVADRARFWSAAVESIGIVFRTSPRETLEPGDAAETPRWLPGARFNIVDSCLRGGKDDTAIVFQAEDGPLERLGVGDLDRLSSRFAAALVAGGARRGDRVAIAMPMTVEAVAAYLGIVKAGCVVVSIADSFAADEIATRLRIAGSDLVVTRDVIHRAGKTLPMYRRVVDAGAGRAIVVAAAGTCLAEPLRPGDTAWEDFLSDDDRFEAVPCGPDDPINILFSSGTTGDPKAIPWTQATAIKCAVDGFLHHDITSGEVIAWPTNLGWMMGPWLIFAALVNRATVGLFYDAPNSAAFCRFVETARVAMLGVVPSLVKVWRAQEMTACCDWSAVRRFSSTGEASNAEEMHWLMSRAGYRPVIEYCGGTEIGGGYITGSVVRPAVAAAFSTPAFGLDFHILDEAGRPADNGELFLVPPSIGLSTALLNRDHHEVYFAGTPSGPGGETLRRHGDQVERLPGGFFRALGRADDTMNLGGIKISSAEIERTVARVDGIRDSAAIAVPPPGGGPDRLVIYLVPEAGVKRAAGAWQAAIQRMIARHLNPLFRIHAAVPVDALPRTASNKVMRRVLRDRYAGP